MQIFGIPDVGVRCGFYALALGKGLLQENPQSVLAHSSPSELFVGIWAGGLIYMLQDI